MQNELKTQAIVLRRTNYGEADRILNLITPDGKVSVIAKGVRKTRSKLAGGVEMFSLVQLVIHRGKGELGVVTSAKMLCYYDKLVTDLQKMELAAMILKKISLAAESSDSPDYFRITNQSLKALNDGLDMRLVEGWFLLNLLKVSGEEVNVHRNVDGIKLDAGRRYAWNANERAFSVRDGGEFGADEIKLLRLMLTTDLMVVARVKGFGEMMPQILGMVRSYYI